LLKVAEKENSNKKILCPILLKNGRVHFRPWLMKKSTKQNMNT
jgi:hypothetical protein